MAIWSVVVDGKRHIDQNGFTRCGIPIVFGTPTEEDGAEPEGKLCKTCYPDGQALEAGATTDGPKSALDAAEAAQDKGKTVAKGKKG